MHTFIGKKQASKNQPYLQGTSQICTENTAAFQFTNNRPEAIVQRKVQSMAHLYASQRPQPIQKKINHTGLPNHLKTGMENLSGLSLDDVKVHRNSDKPAQLQAHAYTDGTDIHLAPGQDKHLPHEAWHVVQQKQGRVQPTLQTEVPGRIAHNGLVQRKISKADSGVYVDIRAAAWYGELPEKQQQVIQELHKNPYQTFTIQEARDIAETNADQHPGDNINVHMKKRYFDGLKKMGVILPEPIAKLHPEQTVIENAISDGVHHIDSWYYDEEQIEAKISDADTAKELPLYKKTYSSLKRFHSKIVIDLRTFAALVLGESQKYNRLIGAQKRSFLSALPDIGKEIRTNVADYNAAFREVFGVPYGQIPLPEDAQVDISSVGEDILDYYHKGTSDDPIPIIWYKPATKYHAVSAYASEEQATDNDRTTTDFPGPATIYNSGPKTHIKGSTVTIGRTGYGTQLNDRIKKVRHDSKREKQRELNEILNRSGHTMGKSSALDGDHIQDLGFDGKDNPNNFWPLDSTINRRGFTDYPGYQVHVKSDDDHLFVRPIGALYGYYFVIKGFQEGDSATVPEESNTEKAGVATDQESDVKAAWE
ncbi:eCIS core domain-containing protein [Spongiimicrobium salis]|uniref:eCIS core domain-containing protein n=1 Tax=Spongiimicrobium salis TaxID=1667022 RepID=UPI00374D3D55